MDATTRTSLLESLKTKGAQNAGELAQQIGVSDMAVRQHLYELQRDKLVSYEEKSQPVGRPVKLWKLTARANRLFPDNSSHLLSGIIQATEDEYGATVLGRIIENFSKTQLEAYRQKMPRTKQLRRRLETLCRLRTEEGYMTELEESPEGQLCIVQNHCPICCAANASQGFCDAERRIFKKLLGDDVELERREHILNGDRRCTYCVIPRKS